VSREEEHVLAAQAARTVNYVYCLGNRRLPAAERAMQSDLSIDDLRRLAMKLPIPLDTKRKRILLKCGRRTVAFTKRSFDAPQDAWVRGIDWVLFIYLSEDVESVSIVRSIPGAAQPEWHEVTDDYFQRRVTRRKRVRRAIK
jgi:hypothetical protein